MENGDTWRILWDDKLVKPRGELIVYAAAATIWASQCQLADVDRTRESDSGRGPVDFKFAAGWRRRALIEVKLLSSSKLFQGASAQLPQYLASQQIRCAYYVCIRMVTGAGTEGRSGQSRRGGGQGSLDGGESDPLLL